MINVSNKSIIAKYIDENKDNIIQKYNGNMSISEIAELYGVAESTIYLRLVKWGIKIKKYRSERRRKNERPIRQKRKFSPELQAKMKENTRINNKHIKFFNTVETGNDKFLVRNILKKSRAVANE
jgi:transposase